MPISLHRGLEMLSLVEFIYMNKLISKADLRRTMKINLEFAQQQGWVHMIVS